MLNILRKIFIVLTILPFGINANSQVEIFPTKLDFGITSDQTQWIVDLIIQNKSGKKDFLLRHTFSHEYEVLYTSKTLLPDSSITLRIKFIPRLKGSFDEKIELYFASMQVPVILPVTAIVESKNPEANIPCPDFSRLAADCCPKNMCLIEIKNANTLQPIPDCKIEIKEQNTTRLNLKTAKDGRTSFEIPIAYYSINAKAAGFEDAVKNTYINNRNSRFTILLTPLKIDPEDSVVPTATTDTTSSESAVAVINSALLPEELYKPNNIVFLLDISGSMTQSDKMQLMKGALLELVQLLRPVDQIALVSYADNATVLLESTSGDQKAVINSKIVELKAGGNTDGYKGFKTSFGILNKNHIKDGNNQLFVITDGAFQAEDQKKIKKLTTKNGRKGFVTSIVGIKSSTFAQNTLQDVSNSGNGSFLQISSEDELRTLTDELKQRSAK